MFGLYIANKLKGKFITINFEQSISPDISGSLSLADAVDGASLVQALETDDFLLFDVFTYADPGFVQVNILPDNDTTKKFRIEATKNPTRVPIMPPRSVEVDLVIDYVNENQANDMFVSFTAMRIPEANLAKLTILSELIPESLENIDAQTFNAQGVLTNLQNIQLSALKVLINLQALQQGKPPIYDVGGNDVNKYEGIVNEYLEIQMRTSQVRDTIKADRKSFCKRS